MLYITVYDETVSPRNYDYIITNELTTTLHRSFPYYNDTLLQ
jgi:hypothetical protein